MLSSEDWYLLEEQPVETPPADLLPSGDNLVAGLVEQDQLEALVDEAREMG